MMHECPRCGAPLDVAITTTTRQPEMLDQYETAKYLGVARTMLAKYRKDGDGPRCAMLGNRWMYRRQWLDEWLESAPREVPDEP